MNSAIVEHVNITVSSPLKTAEMLMSLFDWKIRWQGDSLDDGYTVHVGSESSYLALYANPEPKPTTEDTYAHCVGFNHVGIVVDDLAAIERKVINAGFKPYSHGDYEPGKRFYFEDADGLEIEVISYS